MLYHHLLIIINGQYLFYQHHPMSININIILSIYIYILYIDIMEY